MSVTVTPEISYERTLHSTLCQVQRNNLNLTKSIISLQNEKKDLVVELAMKYLPVNPGVKGCEKENIEKEFEIIQKKCLLGHAVIDTETEIFKRSHPSNHPLVEKSKDVKESLHNQALLEMTKTFLMREKLYLLEQLNR